MPVPGKKGISLRAFLQKYAVATPLAAWLHLTAEKYQVLKPRQVQLVDMVFVLPDKVMNIRRYRTVV